MKAGNKEMYMSSVIEIEETLTEIKQLPTYKTPPQAPQRRGLRARISAILKSVVACNERPVEYMEYCNVPETPLDTLVRKYPYVYADALLG
jgi:hypothetical protein